MVYQKETFDPRIFSGTETPAGRYAEPKMKKIYTHRLPLTFSPPRKRWDLTQCRGPDVWFSPLVLLKHRIK